MALAPLAAAAQVAQRLTVYRFALAASLGSAWPQAAIAEFAMRRLFALSLLLVALPQIRADEPLAYPPPAQVRAAFLKLLDRPKVPAEPKLVSTKSYSPGWVLDQLSIASENKADGTTERVPMLILRPENATKKLPAVIVLHGTGGNMQGQLPFMKELAARNIIGVAIDARYHGERSGGAKGAAAYNEAIVRAWKTKAGAPTEHPFYYDTCWDLWRVAD